MAEPAELDPIDEPETHLPALAEPSRVAVITRDAAFMPAAWEDLERAASLVATAPGMAPQLRRPEAAMFIAYQAARFGADPVALASKTYFTGAGDKERIGYEAQWVMALIESDPLLQEPLAYDYGYADPARPLALGRFVRVTGKLLARTGRVVTRQITTPTVAQIGVKNSPLWFSDADQQLAYYGARAWARRHRPARILGLYTREEIAVLESPAGRPALFEEEDAPEFDTIPPTDAQTKAGERWEAKASGKQDSRDPRDAPDNGGPFKGPDNSPAPPPDSTGNQPDDMDSIKAWAEAERVRIIALDDPAVIATQGEALVADRRFKRLIAYARADAKRIDKSIANRIDELNQ
jgi:hypothetical protein